MTARHLLMAIGLGIAAWLAFLGDKTPSSSVAQPINRTATAGKAAARMAQTTQRTTTAANKTTQPPDIPALQDRDTLIGGAHNGGTGLFGSQSWMPPPPPPPKPMPPPPPMAPPLPFVYMGKKFDGASWEVYFGRGDNTYIVQENAVVDNTYHIDSIKPPIMTLTYLPLKQVQTLNIGGTD
ncbi:MAG TPA: hypothetical protein VIF82_16780 [Burkholderiaceae bacterium]|jgi:hypothetical protein